MNLAERRKACQIRPNPTLSLNRSMAQVCVISNLHNRPPDKMYCIGFWRVWPWIIAPAIGGHSVRGRAIWAVVQWGWLQKFVSCHQVYWQHLLWNFGLGQQSIFAVWYSVVVVGCCRPTSLTPGEIHTHLLVGSAISCPRMNQIVSIS